MSETPFSADEAQRYARHLVLRGFGGAAQQKLRRASVAVIGAGGLGSPVIAYLAAAGIGRLVVIDDDSVALSNLQRQIIHATADIGAPKAETAARFVAGLNPMVEVVAQAVRLDAQNAGSLLAGADVIVDGSDSLATRRIVAATASTLGIPLVSGAVSLFDGQLTSFLPAGPAAFEDLYPAEASDDDIPSCEVAGVFGPSLGVIGSLMAAEAIKIVTGAGEPLSGRLLVYDGRAARFSEHAL